MALNRKKYNNGTGVGGINNYVVNPNDTLAEYQLLMDRAKAEGESNIWASTIIPTAASLLTKFGPSLAGAVQGGEQVAAMGKTNAAGQIEVEGDEVIESPTGQVAQVQGPSHEQGGVDMNVDPGTRIYSDRIKVGGKTMAERKKARENLLLGLDKKSSTRQGDEATKNSVNRMRSNIEKEEESDLIVQELADKFQSMSNQFAMGTGKEGVQEYANGTSIYGVQPSEEEQPIATFMNNFNTHLPVDNVNQLQPIGTTYNQAFQEGQQVTFPNKAVVTNPSISAKSEAPSTGYMPTAGDMTSLFGDLISTFGPMQNTKANRAGDTPNINAFKNFGQDAINTNENVLGLVKGQAANASTRLKRNAVAMKRSARNSSRSVNTQRATDTLIDLETNAQELGVDDNLSRQMMQILGNKSQLQNVQDQVVMGGDQQKDLADRQDRDNFYTQMAQDISTKGQGVQTIGKDLNALAENDMYMKMLNQMSKYFQFDSKGNIVGINQAKKK